MDDNSLSPELLELERGLCALPRAEAPESLRERTLVHLRRDLQQENIRKRWTFAAAAAVAVLVWINLSMSASLLTGHDMPSAMYENKVESNAQQILQMLPELSEQEAYRQALILQARPVLGGQSALVPSALVNTQPIPSGD